MSGVRVAVTGCAVSARSEQSRAIEAKLIRRMERLALTWPSRNYMIASMGGTLCLFRSDDRFVDGEGGLDPEKALWMTDAIPNTGGDW